MSASEFSGLDVSIEPVRGARAFEVDRLGRLTGVSHQAIWTPGENASVCDGPGDGATWSGVTFVRNNFAVGGTYQIGGVTYSIPDAGQSVPDVMAAAQRERLAALGSKPRHDMAKCSCGFYAYYDGSNDYGGDGRVSAVIEGYGETVIGTRGFRAGKARILALCIPGAEAKTPPKQRNRFHRLRHWLDEHVIGSVVAIGGGLVTLYALATTVVCAISWLTGDRNGTGAAFWIALPVAVAGAFSTVAAWWWPDNCCRPVATHPRDAALASELIAKIRRNYPETPLYASFKEMVADFPLTGPAEATPDDPDFWTRAS